jgi:hypothetical protein
MPDEFTTQPRTTTSDLETVIGRLLEQLGAESGIKDHVTDWISQIVKENRKFQECAIRSFVMSSAEMLPALGTEESSKFDAAEKAISRISSRFDDLRNLHIAKKNGNSECPEMTRLRQVTSETQFHTDVETIKSFCSERKESFPIPFKDPAMQFIESAVSLYADYLSKKKTNEDVPLLDLR